jgi:hypothetical protein
MKHVLPILNAAAFVVGIALLISPNQIMVDARWLLLACGAINFAWYLLEHAYPEKMT